MEQQQKNTLKNILNSEIALFLKDLTIIIIIVFVIRLFIAMPFQISGKSMQDSYYNKEFIIVDKISYIIGTPKRGDVIVFKPHVSQNKEYFLKRIIGVPGDKLKIEKGEVFVQPKGKSSYVKLNETYLNDSNKGKTWVGTEQNKSHEYILGEDDYFVIGDNRNHSTDSRECFSDCLNKDEFISKSDMVGKVFLDLGYFNFGKMRFITDTGDISTPKFFDSPSTHFYSELQ